MISIGIGALIFSIWLIILFFGKNIGLSMILFVIPFSCFFIYILKINNRIKKPKFKLLLIPILLLSSTYFIFDNTFFNILNLVIIPLLQSILILGLLGEKFEIRLDIIGKFLNPIFDSLCFIGESTLNFIANIKKKLKIDIESKKEENIKKIFKAILITVPVVLIILILLSTADEIFANLFENIFYTSSSLLSGINIFTVFIKIFCMVIAFFYLIGLFYYMAFKYKVIDEKIISESKINDNFTIKIILVSLNIIYLVFCYIQIKSLFMRNTTLNYAEYARQGFFQLMVVSIINLVTILIAKRSENKDEYKTNKFIKYMSLLMILFTFIIVISAGVRMYFYENAYGYTLLRLLVYCILFSEVILFIPTIIYILDFKIKLTKSYFIILVTIYLCMNFANFNSIIAKRNMHRYVETGVIDLDYLKYSTGSEGIKEMLKILEAPTDVENIKSETANYLREKYDVLTEENIDFRDFNISKIIARNLIKDKINLDY